MPAARLYKNGLQHRRDAPLARLSFSLAITQKKHLEEFRGHPLTYSGPSLPFDFTLPVCYRLDMGNRALKRRIVSLRARIAEHELKIVQEKQSLLPDYGLITHWQVEIDAFRSSLERALKRIG